MKIKIKTFYGKLPNYLTNGKVYIANKEFDGAPFAITSDDGKQDYISIDDCGHLNGGSWEVIDELLNENPN